MQQEKGIIPALPSNIGQNVQTKAPGKLDADEKSIRGAERGQPNENDKKPFWLTRAMAENFTRQDVLYTTLREAVLYFLFITAITICTMGRRSSILFYQTQALKGQFIENEFETVSGDRKTFMDVKSADDFWSYLENSFLDSFYWQYYYANYGKARVKEVGKFDEKILFENAALGVPRIRQVKVKNDSCFIHWYFKRLFRSCYDIYSEYDQEREPFGPGNGTPWVYKRENSSRKVYYETSTSSIPGGGYYQDLTTDRNKSLELIVKLKENLWITPGTRAVFIDFALYNANIALFSVCKLAFEFPPTGGIIPSYKFATVKLFNQDLWDRVTFAFECTVYAIAAFFVLEEIREIFYFKWRYFLQFWTWIDLAIIGLASANFLTSLIVFPKSDATIKKVTKNPDKYANLEYLAAEKVIYNNFAAALLFFSYIKVFKYLSFNKTMGQLNHTLKSCAADIVAFMVLFFLIFLAFSELGYLLFGSQVEDFSSFTVAMLTLLRTILGDFDYSAIEKANKYSAPFFFLSYLFLVFFVLLNMFLAIITDTYSDVTTENAIAPEEMQMTEFVKNGFTKFLAKMNCKFECMNQDKAEFYRTIQEIRDALNKCGYSDNEVELFFAKYNIDTNSVGAADYDLKKVMKRIERDSRGKDKVAEDVTVVHVSDFITQQERLDYIDRSVQLLAMDINKCLKKLDGLEAIRRRRMQAT